jgi:hypothetical protein
MLLVAGCFALGWSARRFLPDAAAVAALLDRFVLGVALPALVLAKLPDVALAGALVPAAVAWAGLAVSVTLVLVAARARSWDPTTLWQGRIAAGGPRRRPRRTGSCLNPSLTGKISAGRTSLRPLRAPSCPDPSLTGKDSAGMNGR